MCKRTRDFDVNMSYLLIENGADLNLADKVTIQVKVKITYELV